MIQDIAPHHYNNAYHPVKPELSDYCLYFEPGKALLKQNGDEIAFPTFREISEMYRSTEENDDGFEAFCESVTYLFQIDEHRYYLTGQKEVCQISGYEMTSTAVFRDAEPQYLAFAGITAYQLYDWYRSRQFCGRCGQPMHHDKKERMMFCESCHMMEYPKLSPAVIIAVTHKNRLLLSKYAGRTFKKYALLAGFVEIGETVEETVSREVMEEVGLPVKNIRYYKSQPWSFSGTELMGFYCDLDGDDENITLDQEELALAEWFDRGGIPVEYSRDSLTNEMIMTFKKGKEPR
jgi:NAD+ diphosphatase